MWFMGPNINNIFRLSGIAGITSSSKYFILYVFKFIMLYDAECYIEATFGLVRILNHVTNCNDLEKYKP